MVSSFLFEGYCFFFISSKNELKNEKKCVAIIIQELRKLTHVVEKIKHLSSLLGRRFCNSANQTIVVNRLPESGACGADINALACLL